MDLITYKNQDLKPQKDSWLSKLSRYFDRERKADAGMYSDSNSVEVIDSLRSAKNEWINANLNFEYAEDQEMVDYYTYKIKASQVRYEYYLKKAKEMGVKVDNIDAANIGSSNVSLKD